MKVELVRSNICGPINLDQLEETYTSSPLQMNLVGKHGFIF